MPKPTKKIISQNKKPLQSKAAPKQTVNDPSSFIHGAPIVYKPPPIPKGSKKEMVSKPKIVIGDTGSQWDGSKQGFLAPNTTDPYLYDPFVILPDGSKVQLPKKQVTY